MLENPHMELCTKFLFLFLGKVLQNRDRQWDVLVEMMSGFVEFCCIKKYLQDVTEDFFFTQPHIGEIESFVLHCNT